MQRANYTRRRMLSIGRWYCRLSTDSLRGLGGLAIGARRACGGPTKGASSELMGRDGFERVTGWHALVTPQGVTAPSAPATCCAIRVFRSIVRIGMNG